MLLTLLSPQGVAGTINVALAATEAQDTAAMAVSLPNTVSLAATEAKDTAAMAVTSVNNASLAATEAKDTASASITFTAATGVTVALAATEAQDIAAVQVNVQQPIIVDDTHDGDYLPRKFKRERDERKKRKRDIINAYEVLVEGRSPVIEELIAQYADPVKPTAKAQAPQLNIDKLLNNADAAQRLWNAYIDMDDEEILLLL